MSTALDTVSMGAQACRSAGKSPNDQAGALTGRRYLSWSQIRNFRACPRRYAFEYVERAEPAFMSSALIFGGAMHAAIQSYFERRLAGEDAPLEELLAAYRDGWHERHDELDGVPVRYAAKEDAASLAKAAESLLAAFLTSDLASPPPGGLIAVEERLEGTLADDLPDLLAVVDLIYADEGGWHVVDFKTSKAKYSDLKVAEAADQLRLYEQLVRPMAGPDVALRLHFGVLVKTKTPTVQRLDLPVTSDAGDRLVDTIRPIWRAMSQGVDFANPSVAACAGCPYRDRCPAAAAG